MAHSNFSKEIQDNIEQVDSMAKRLMAKVKPNQDLIDMQNTAITLGKCGLSTKQFIKQIP